MNRISKLFGILMLGVLVFSSCSKQKYTASFSAPPAKKWVKIEDPKTVDKINQIEMSEEATAMSEEVVAPSLALEKPTKNMEEEAIAPKSFTKAEIKSTKKELRKTVFKAAKRSLFRKNKTNSIKSDDDKLVAVILSILIPPLGVWYYQQGITNDFWLDLILLLTWFGSIIYALLVVFDVVSIA